MVQFFFATLAAIVSLGCGLQFIDRTLVDPWSHNFTQRGDVERPRMLAMRGCSGSSAIMVFARELLRYHGIPVPMPAAPNTVNGTALPPTGLGWPAELLKKEINWFYQVAGDMGNAMLMANENIRSLEQTLFFKGMVQQLAHEDEYRAVESSFKQMQPFIVVGSRKNMLDQVICQIKDCFQENYGHPVDQMGQESKLCFSRRGDGKPVTIDSAASSHSLLAVSQGRANTTMCGQDDGYMAFLERGKIVQNIEREYKLVRQAREHLLASGLNFTVVSEEDLLEFQTRIPGAMERAVAAWSELLNGFGVKPRMNLLRKYLRQFENTYPAPPPHWSVVYNMQDVIDELDGTPYYDHIRWW